MRIVNEDLLAEFRRYQSCEWCGKRCWPDPHHVFCRGMGGGSRLDIRINLLALCRECHSQVHGGEIRRIDLLMVVAGRENVQIDAIVEEIWRLRRERR